jgi:TRAP-type transport system small permease protein
MSDEAAKNRKEKPAPTAIGKIADTVRRIMTPVVTWSAYAGAAVLGLMVLMLIYTIIARRAFEAPLKGSLVLTALALGVITFLIVAYDSLKGESMIVEILIDRFPARVKSIIGVIIHFLSVAILGMLCWQLLVQTIKFFNYHQTTATLAIPIYPFLALAAFGILLLTLVYVMHFFESLAKLRKN